MKINPHAFIDLTGKTYGRLTVIKLSHMTKDGSYWFCSCKCNDKIRSKPYKANSIKSGKSLSCGCLHVEAMALKRKNELHHALWNQKYLAYKNNARSRNRSFELTVQDFKEIALSPCAYCDRLMVNKAESDWDILYYNGIDRKNNMLGYTKENSVSCYGDCNMLKGKFTYEKFLNLIKMIYHNLK